MSTALVIVDMLNPYQHQDAEPLRRSVARVLPATADLIRRARSSDALLVYVNDNYEDWCAGRAELVERALAGADPSLVEPIVRPPETPFVVKAWRGTASRRSTRTSRKLRFG
jgi:nicotinamidase-related amidase